MKIRIKGNSLRLRLTTEEWNSFCEDGKVEDCISFGHRQKLIYTLRVTDRSDTLVAHFNHPFIMVLVPRNMANAWINQGAVGISEVMPLPDGGQLKLLIEKDFQCLHDRGEQETVLFPHPDSTAR